MLRSTRKEISSKALVSNCAGVIGICILLLAATVIIPQGNLYNGLLPSAYAQQAEDEEEQETQEQGEEGGGAEEQAELGEEESAELFTVEIISNGTEGVAPATFEFEANLTGGTEPYSYVWNFDDDVEETADEQTVLHTFDEAGIYNVSLLVTDSEDQIAFDSIVINVEEQAAAEEETAAEEGTTAADLEELAAEEGTTAADLEELAAEEGIDLEELAASGGIGLEQIEDLLNPQPDPTEPETPEEPPAGEEPPANDTEEPPAGEEPTDPGQGGEDRSGVDQIYPTAENGPVWYIKEQEDPTTDGYFYYGMYRTTTVDYLGSGVWHVDAETGTEEHGIRMHVDSPSGKWVNTEITGYFKVLTGQDQITMIARHGPSYHDDEGCQAYGYYGMTAVDGEVFFKKKLYHYDGGYTERLAQIDALENLIDRWVGMKFVVYDLENGDVKLELWIDEGDMTNNWKKVTELVDDGGLHVEGGDDCGIQSNHIIRDGTRSSYRVDDSSFDFKELSVREIEP